MDWNKILYMQVEASWREIEWNKMENKRWDKEK